MSSICMLPLRANPHRRGLEMVSPPSCHFGSISKPTNSSQPNAEPIASWAASRSSTTHEFWKSIHAGALKAAGELSQGGRAVEIIWKGPLREDDREQQVQVVESFTSQGVSGIVLAPLDASALVRPVEEARRLKIPTVIFDSALNSKDIVSYVATDNYKGGELAA